jgi:hypothetical protein
LEEVKKRFVFTTHTPEEAGNEKHDFRLLHDFSFFGSVPNGAALSGFSIAAAVGDLGEFASR